MEGLREQIEKIVADAPQRMVISKPAAGEVRRVEAARTPKGWQLASYTATQVFHKNVDAAALVGELESLLTESFMQLNAWCDGAEWSVMQSKKGKLTAKRRAAAPAAPAAAPGHDRKKQYILREGESIPPLVDMGVFTAEGRVVRSMYDKFRQINRFLEIVDDEAKKLGGDELKIIDFGCGKSYLTFVLYHYFTAVRGKKVKMIGLDLKADVIEKCSRAAEKYGYEGLRFELGDINGYEAPFVPDIVVSLHACDTATDFALFNAVSWGAKLIFSVPCCQHELNRQMKTAELALLTRYGIVQDRTAALLTDALRANLLEWCGYKTQILEFIDFEHTPKNLLIRAVKAPGVPAAARRRYRDEAEKAMAAFSVQPAFYRLLEQSGRL